jgi:SAM-dependent methyltransferase
VSDTADAATLAVYDRDAAAYAEWSSASPRGPLQAFLARMPEGGAALDLGCGAGWAAAEMTAAGLRVRAVDGSAGLVAEARRRGVPAEEARFEEIAEVDAYDGVWASYSLLHAPRETMPDLLARIRRALKPGGVLYLGLKEGEGERRDALGRRYVYWSEPALTEALAAGGFGAPVITRETSTGWDGAEEGMMDVFVDG